MELKKEDFKLYKTFESVLFYAIPKEVFEAKEEIPVTVQEVDKALEKASTKAESLEKARAVKAAKKEAELAEIEKEKKKAELIKQLAELDEPVEEIKEGE